MRFMSQSPRETKHFASVVLTAARKQKARPVVLALSGELGSGKTAFIQGLAASLGIREKVHSPTFVLMKRYRLPKGQRPLRHFVHVDAYRLESLAEARHLGLQSIFRDRDAIAVIEWADRIRKLVPRGALWIQFSHGRHLRERIIKIQELLDFEL